jgi:hypothetical protein
MILAYIQRLGGDEEVERRQQPQMARKSGYRLAGVRTH